MIVFEPIFIVAITFAGLSSWKYFEKRYDEFLQRVKEGLADKDLPDDSMMPRTSD